MLLTHQILVVIIVGVVDDSHSVSLIVPAQSTRPESVAVHGGTTLEAGLAQTLVQALTQRSPGDLRVEFAAQSRVPVTLEGRVRSTSAREQMRGDRIIRILSAAF